MLLNATDWDEFVQSHPQAHILQTAAWGRLKAETGWQAETVRAGAAGALVLFRRALGLTLAYVPRGPLVNWSDGREAGELLARLDAVCRARGAFCLKLEPELPDGADCIQTLRGLGLAPSAQTVQPRRSLVVDLSGSEADVLGRMRQKTRYNIGLAARKGVTARVAAGEADLRAFAGLMTATGARDGFGVHTAAYYSWAYELFRSAGQCELLLGEYQGQALAGVMVFSLGRRSWYFYGASSDRERNRMAPYLAQWEAMRWARARGAADYDLWGVPDADEAVLEAGFETRHDGLWGVYRFKRGFGGRLVRTVGAWDRVYRPAIYAAYQLYLKARRRTNDEAV
jgi:lipid II:glycine glycyltransferase (peptidoglycan interpeptide bridge formation enzyme)